LGVSRSESFDSQFGSLVHVTAKVTGVFGNIFEKFVEKKLCPHFGTVFVLF